MAYITSYCYLTAKNLLKLTSIVDILLVLFIKSFPPAPEKSTYSSGYNINRVNCIIFCIDYLV